MKDRDGLFRERIRFGADLTDEELSAKIESLEKGDLGGKIQAYAERSGKKNLQIVDC